MKCNDMKEYWESCFCTAGTTNEKHSKRCYLDGLARRIDIQTGSAIGARNKHDLEKRYWS